MSAPTATVSLLRTWSRRDGRWWVLVLVPLYVGIFLAAVTPHGRVSAALPWGVTVMEPVFADLHVIAAGVATKRAGGDPFVDNPFDPWHRPYNYPALWLHLFGASQSPAVIRTIALGMFGLCFAGVLAYLGPLSHRRGLFVALLGCSPPVLLAVQRANTDLLMLAIIAGSLCWLQRRATAWIGYAGIAAGGFLKLYPFVGFIALIRERGRRFALALTAAVVLVASCLWLNAPELSRVAANTGFGRLQSYGCRVIVTWAEILAPMFGAAVDNVKLERAATTAALVVLLAAMWTAVRRRPAATGRAPAHVDGLRVGGAIYTLTFLAGSSFDYRLVFLAVCLPGLFDLIDGPSRRDRRWAMAALALIALTLWPNGVFAGALGLFKEAASWALYFTLAVILSRSIAMEFAPGRTLPSFITSHEER